MVSLLSISELRAAAHAGRVAARVHGQIYSLTQKETQQKKPFYELILADAETRFVLRAWNDAPNFKLCAELKQGAFLEALFIKTFALKLVPEGPYTLAARMGLRAEDELRWENLEPTDLSVEGG